MIRIICASAALAVMVIYLDHAEPNLLEVSIPAAVPASIAARTELPEKKACIMSAWGQAAAGQESAVASGRCKDYSAFKDAEPATGRLELAER